MNAELLLEKVASKGLHGVSEDEIVKLACAYWHEEFYPDEKRVRNLPIEQQKIIGYLTDFFSGFYCVDEPRALKLVEFSGRLKDSVKPETVNSNDHDLAAEWGLSDNIYDSLTAILDYQTRHYTHRPSDLSA